MIGTSVIKKLKLPDLKILNLNIERISSIMILEITLDEHISCRDHIRTVESKIAKNIILLNYARQVLTEASLIPIFTSILIM